MYKVRGNCFYQSEMSDGWTQPHGNRLNGICWTCDAVEGTVVHGYS